MKPFTFRANVALDVRRRQEEEARKALATATQRVHQALDAEAVSRRGLSEAIEAATAAAHQGAASAAVGWYRNWIDQKRRDVARDEGLRRQREREAQDAQREASAARRRLRALEKLKSRAFAAYQGAERHEEQLTLDEIGARQYANRQREDELDG